MLRSIKKILGYRIQATDSQIGEVDDFLFDGRQWTIRYLVADTGHWLPGRQVLIAPASLGHADWSKRILPVKLTRQQVEDSPEISTDQPVSRQRQILLHQHYGWPLYWDEADMSGAMIGAMIPRLSEVEKGAEAPQGDPNLRSAREIRGYSIEALDGLIGHVDDFIVEDDSWIIRYLVVETRNLLPGKRVLLAPSWVKSLVWEERRVHVDLTRAAIENSPEFNPADPVNRVYEEVLCDYYGRPKYWEVKKG
ncbi:MAG: PRC-barrel domain-containing protein [Candidatus Sumerlaeota bacterium]|nr:PRC-barrel domain-containing protein [Candidatus Sumerlaeota bacterium]